MTLAEIVFPVPLDKGFDYRVPDALAAVLKPGHRVLAPLGARNDIGVVVRLHDGAGLDYPLEKIKPLTALLDPQPALSAEDLALAAWLARRTFCGKGEAVFGVLPVGKMRPPKRGAQAKKDDLPPLPANTRPAVLTDDQAAALSQLLPAVQAGAGGGFLLHGVNASGKTEVYLRLIEDVLARGRTAFLLVPEIGLTPQTEAHLKSRFGAVVGIWHSELGRGERWRLWEAVRAGSIRVVAGPRSALFLPLPKPGLIVLDEEHDPSYKNETAPCYHARDAALEKGRLHRCPVILGSATPSMESLHAARERRLTPVRMTGRVGNRPFPQVRIVDLREEKGWYMSNALVDALRDRLAKGEQSLLFLNRRGYATQVLCKECGWEAKCPHCAISLVYHKPGEDMGEGRSKKREGKPQEPRQMDLGEFSISHLPSPSSLSLHCHTCEHKQAFPERCPACKGDVVKYRGRGTQRVEADLKQLFPQARLLRWDRDTTQKKSAHHRAFTAVRGDGVDIVIGTQMIAQGLDFPRVTLGGVLDADRSLRFPDFRASERSFQLLSQVAGRVGRGTTPGQVILQTRYPDHHALKAAEHFDYDTFADTELAFRRDMAYPPFVRLAVLLLRAKDAAKVQAAAEALTRHLEETLPEDVQALGPAPAFHHVREGFSQWQVLLKAPPDRMEAALPSVKGYDLPAGVTLTVDVDPEELA